MGPKKFPVEQARLLLRQRSRLMVGLPAHEIVNTLAAAMSALTGFPNVTALGEPAGCRQRDVGQRYAQRGRSGGYAILRELWVDHDVGLTLRGRRIFYAIPVHVHRD